MISVFPIVMYKSERKNIILQGRALLKITRPDRKSRRMTFIALITIIIITFMFILFVSSEAGPIYFLALAIFFSGLSALIYFVLKDYPIVISETGIMQGLRTYYWGEIEAYSWLPVLTNYYMITFLFSDSAPLRLRKIRKIPPNWWTARHLFLVHVSFMDEINNLFNVKGIPLYNWEKLYKQWLK